MIVRWLAACCVTIAGCSNLTAIDHPVCGNGIIEDGEDCDSPLAYCQACSIACDTTDTCVGVAGPGFVCGADALCHAPAGLFVERPSVILDVDTLQIADIDGDGVGDVIAQSPTTLDILYGDADGAFTRRADVQAPIAQGPVTWSNLDGDDRPDLLVPTADGIAGFTFKYGVPSPYTWPFALQGGATAEALTAFPLSDRYVGTIVTIASGDLEFVVLDVSGGQPDQVVGSTPLCGGKAGDFDPLRSSLVAAGSQPSLVHFVYAAVLASGGNSKACVIAIDQKLIPNPAAPFNLTDISPPALPKLDSTQRPLLVDVNGLGGCPTLIAQTDAGGLVGFAPKDNGGLIARCTLLAAQVIARKAPDGSAKTGGAPVGSLLLGGSDVGIVLTDGVYIYAPGSPAQVTQLYVSDRTLASVDATRLDGDAAIDLVAIGDNTEDFDLLYQVQPTPPMPGVYSFLRVRVHTDAPITQIQTGDYDGNGIDDVVYVERFADGDHLSVAYGTSDRPLPGQPVATFASVLSLLKFNLPDSNDPFRMIDDVVVLYQDGGDRHLAVLHGSPQRTLQAYFTPFGIPTDATPQVAATLPGLFGSGMGGHDLLALGTVGAIGTVLMLTPAAPDGALYQTPSCGMTTTIASCSAANLSNRDLCTNFAMFTVAPLGDREAMIAVDGRGDAITIDPAGMGGCSLANLANSTPVPLVQWGSVLGLEPSPPLRRPRPIELISTDPPELAVTLLPPRDAPGVIAVTRTCLVGPDGVPSSCADPSTVVSDAIGAPAVCGDLDVGHVFPVSRLSTVAPPSRNDLIVMCDSADHPHTLYRISRFADHTDVAPLLAVPGTSEIKIGDVNGDAIDDILTINRGNGTATMHVYLQCTSRNRDACAAL